MGGNVNGWKSQYMSIGLDKEDTFKYISFNETKARPIWGIEVGHWSKHNARVKDSNAANSSIRRMEYTGFKWSLTNNLRVFAQKKRFK